MLRLVSSSPTLLSETSNQFRANFFSVRPSCTHLLKTSLERRECNASSAHHRTRRRLSLSSPPLYRFKFIHTTPLFPQRTNRSRDLPQGTELVPLRNSSRPCNAQKRNETKSALLFNRPNDGFGFLKGKTHLVFSLHDTMRSVLGTPHSLLSRSARSA